MLCFLIYIKSITQRHGSTIHISEKKKRITILLMHLAQTEEQKYQSTIYLLNILLKLKEKR